MVLGALFLLLLGLLLSALFSGSETGFYRVSRMKLVTHAMEGDQVSRRLLFFANRPALFVATALIGNNTANYLTSLSIVLATRTLFGSGPAVEMTASVLFSPILFVYGELMPKQVYYQAPHYLLRRTNWLFTGFAVLLAPLSLMLWGLGNLLEKLLGQSLAKVRLTLAKQELGEVLLEGQHAGVIKPSQLHLAQDFFLVATNQICEMMVPLSKVTIISATSSSQEALEYLRQQNLNELAVKDESSERIVGYLKTIELELAPSSESIADRINPMVDVKESDRIGEAVIQMNSAKVAMARVVDATGKTTGTVSARSILASILLDGNSSTGDVARRNR